MNKDLERAVATVMQERTGKFNASFANVAAVVPGYPHAELADRLIADIPSTVPWEVAADILGILMWSTSDNGASIMRCAEQWLIQAKDLRRTRVALSLDFYPFRTADEMRRVLADVASRFPELAQRCNAIVSARARLPE